MPSWRRVRQGFEVVIEQDSRSVAVLNPPQIRGRKISELIAALEASGASAVIDEDFARDVDEGIKSYREPWNPPSWDWSSTPASWSPPSERTDNARGDQEYSRCGR